MGDCKYCGQKAGLFSHTHAECEEKHRLGLQDMTALTAQCVRTGEGFDNLESRLTQIAKENFIAADQIRPSMIDGWEQALDLVLRDNLLTDDEESHFVDFKKHFDLTQDDLDKDGAYTRLGKSQILRLAQEGRPFKSVKVDGPLPFNLQNSETLAWAFPNVPYYVQKVQRHFEGVSQGVSIRVMKGVYCRVGEFKGRPVESTEWALVETGLLGVTSQNLYFAGPVKSLRIPYKKIVSFTPYDDGIGICRDAASAKPEIFKTGDGWFTYNLIINLAKQG